MKNVQVIDGAENAVYNIFAATDEEFPVLFPPGEGVAFMEEAAARTKPTRLKQVLAGLW